MTNLKNVQKQIEFMVSLHEKSLEEYLQEYEKLAKFLDEKASNSLKNEQIQKSFESVKEVIFNNFDKIKQESEEEVEFLNMQLEMIKQVSQMEPSDARTEVENLILQDVGEIEELEAFEKRMKCGREASKQDFFQTLDEIKEFVEEGSIEDLATFCQASKMLEEQGEIDEDDDFDEDEDLLSDSQDDHLEDKFFKLADNEKIKEILENYKNPYFVEGLKKNKSKDQNKN